MAQPKPNLTDLLRHKLREAFSFREIERDTSIKRQSLAKFLRGEQSLRLDLADDLARHFGIVARMANTFVLSWVPKDYTNDDYRKDALADFRADTIGDWSVGNTKKIEASDRVFLLRQGQKNPGIVGTGWAESRPYLDKNWRGSGQRQYVDVHWELLIDPDEHPPLSTHLLPVESGKKSIWKNQSSGVSVPPGLARQVEALWHRHVLEHRIK